MKRNKILYLTNANSGAKNLSFFFSLNQKYSMSASYLDIILNRDIIGKLTTPYYEQMDDFNFSVVIKPLSPAYGVYVSQLI